MRVSEQIHFFNLFSVLEQPTWLVLGDARNAAKLILYKLEKALLEAMLMENKHN